MARMLTVALVALALLPAAAFVVAQEEAVEVPVGDSVAWSVEGTPVKTLTVVAIAGLDGDYAYEPDDITVSVGTEVIWTNQSDDVHTVTSEDDGPLNSGGLGDPIAVGEDYAHVFDTAGEFDYFCELHPMDGTIVVE